MKVKVKWQDLIDSFAKTKDNIVEVEAELAEEDWRHQLAGLMREYEVYSKGNFPIEDFIRKLLEQFTNDCIKSLEFEPFRYGATAADIVRPIINTVLKKYLG